MPIKLEQLSVDPIMEDALEFVDKDSWRTPFTAVSWAYDPLPGSIPTSLQHQSAFHSYLIPTFYAKPPHYHNALYTRHPLSSPVIQGGQTDIQTDLPSKGEFLNPDLIGVKRTSEVLTAYELHVGFDSIVTISDSGPSSRIRHDIHPNVIVHDRERCQRHMRELTNGRALSQSRKHENQYSSPTPIHIFAPSPSRIRSCTVPRSSLFQNLHSSSPISAAKSLGSTGSKYSPSNHHFSHASDCTIGNVHPTPQSTTPIQPVVEASFRSGLKFSRPSTPSLAFTNFTFPSLNEPRHISSPSRLPSKGIHDSHHEQATSHTGKISTSSPKSKAPALVTMLRADTTPISSPSSSPNPADSPSSSSSTSHNVNLDFFSRNVPNNSEDGMDSVSSLSSPSILLEVCEDEGDGWVRTSPAEPSIKDRQTTDPSVVSSNRRSDSPSRASAMTWTNTSLNNDDGWIEAPSQLLSRRSPKPFVRKQGTRIPLVPMPPPPLAYATVYPTLPYVAPIIPPTGSLPVLAFVHPANTHFQIQMQMHLQTQMQMQMQACSGLHADWYPAPQPVFVPAAPRFIPGTSAIVGARYHGVSSAITGAAGMRHVHW